MSDYLPYDEALLTQLLAQKEAFTNAKPSAVAAREATIAEKKKIAEDACLSAHFEEIGLGDVPEEHQQDVELLLKSAENLSQGFEDARASENAKWFKDKTATKFVADQEKHFFGLISSAIQLISRTNLGNYKQDAVNKATKIQETTRKRQREQEEKDEPPHRLGCTCGHKSAGHHGKCHSTRCPCRQAGIPCSDNCRCTVDNCKNPAGLPPPRPERRGRPALKIPEFRNVPPDSLASTREFPRNRRPTLSEASYEPSDSDSDGGSPVGQRQYRTKQTARPSQVCALFCCFVLISFFREKGSPRTTTTGNVSARSARLVPPRCVLVFFCFLLISFL